MAKQVLASQVREWATGKGYAVGGRGRIAADVIEEFNKAHKRTPYVPADETPEGLTEPGGPLAGLTVTRTRATRRPDGRNVFVCDVQGTLTFAIPE